MKTTNTTDKIAALLKRGRSITPIQALETLNCFRLSARINDLRNAGMEILTLKHRTESGKTVAKYKLA
jgi:hypothetical protein